MNESTLVCAVSTQSRAGVRTDIVLSNNGLQPQRAQVLVCEREYVPL